MFFPEIAQQFHFTIRKVVLRAGHDDRLHVGRDLAQLVKVKFLELNVFVFDKRFQNRDRALFPQRRLFVAEHVAERIFLPFNQVHHGASQGLFALECRHARAFPEGHATLVYLGHLGGLNRLISALVIDHDQTLVGDHLVLIEELLGA